MGALDSLVGQTLVAVTPETGNTGLRFTGASLGIYAPVEDSTLSGLVGRVVTGVETVEDEYVEIGFVGGASVRIITNPNTLEGPEAYCLRLDGGPIVVG